MIPPKAQRRFFFSPGCDQISRDGIVQMLRQSWYKEAQRQQSNLSNLCYCLEKVISTKLIIYSGQPLVENTLHWCFLLLGCLLLNLPCIDFTERDRQPALTAPAEPWLVEKKLCAQVSSEISSSRGQLSERIAAFLPLLLSSKNALYFYTLLILWAIKPQL